MDIKAQVNTGCYDEWVTVKLLQEDLASNNYEINISQKKRFYCSSYHMMLNLIQQNVKLKLHC